jgi:hypothetical protein
LIKDTVYNLHSHPVILGILGDKKAIPYLIDRFKHFDKLYQKHPMSCYCDKMQILNALYHLASPEMIPFLEEIIRTPRDVKYQDRAELVLARVKELFPEEKIH